MSNALHITHWRLCTPSFTRSETVAVAAIVFLSLAVAAAMLVGAVAGMERELMLAGRV